ncbi:MAG TPA: CGNR zinc finger domain-containing protein [Streptosporangiaceae bacterium]|nr:CGNR zinc finger domain-containing protein [Streptosporangiaceae bacterium]
MPPGTTPQRQPIPVLLALANARQPRRPAGAREWKAPDPFASYPAAHALLEPLNLSQPLAEDELGDLAALADQALAIAEALTGQRPLPDLGTLNRFAEQAHATQVLRASSDGTLHAELRWRASSAVSELARRIVAEVGRLDPARLRRCSRQACNLLFYDTTRPGTQRWHSESPCGLRERQARWRKASTGKIRA